jgi:hypothetical protein
MLPADIEVIAADTINEANERVLVTDVRFRFAIDQPRSERCAA